MKKLVLLLLSILGLQAAAQTKKAALVSVYVHNRVEMTGFTKANMPVGDIDGDFTPDLKPLVKQFRDSLMRRFPTKYYKLLPEAQVTGNPKYPYYRPRYYDDFDPQQCTSLPGYKIIYIEDAEMASKQLGMLLPNVDAFLYAEITFTMISPSTPGEPPTLHARADLKILDKDGKQVWASSVSSVRDADATVADPYAPKAVFELCKDAMAGLTSFMKDGL